MKRCVTLAAALLLCATTTVAQDTDPPSEADREARTRFQLGQQYYEQGRFAEAAAEFELAYEASPRAALLYNLYIAHRDGGNVEGATDALRRYLATDAPEASARPNFEARLRALEAQLRGEASPASPPPPERASSSDVSPAPYVVLGVGGAMLVASVITGALSLDQKAQIDALCPTASTCEPGFEAVASTGEGLSIATDVLWIGGLVAASVGAVLLVIDLTSQGNSEQAAVQATCGLAGCAIRGRF